jgi:predicted dehydrogenase
MTAANRQRCIVIGYGVQGRKRRAIAGSDVAAIVDPVAEGANYRYVRDVPLGSYDSALVCTPDGAKSELLGFLLGNGKNVLVEKPLLATDDATLVGLQDLARRNEVICYTAYNHRFEPHFVRMRDLLASGTLGEIYSLRMFYGNGTARLVRQSGWRDQGAGVLPDLGSHLLDTLMFWLPEAKQWTFHLRAARRHENASFDQVVLDAGPPSGPLVQLEMMLLSWRNHYTADVFAEKGSAHIESLCKWGPSRFTNRRRILPSGRPPEESVVLVQDDPTWESEYDHFLALCAGRARCDLETDVWINRTLNELSRNGGLVA